MTAVPVGSVKAVEKDPGKAPESDRSEMKMRLHISMLLLTGVTTAIMMHLHLDQRNTALFSFGPLGPSVVTEVVDFIKGL